MAPVDTLSREELLSLVTDLLRVTAEQQSRIRQLEAEVARLRGGDPPSSAPREVPPFVKPNRPKRADKERKPRRQGHARRREAPTATVAHAPERCGDCGRTLRGGWTHATRQVIDIPWVPYEVVEHRFVARQCGVCGKREFRRPDLSAEAYGQSRFGVRLMSFIAYLDTVCRMPVKAIQRLLQAMHGLHVSVGEIVRVLHTVADAGKDLYQSLLEEVRRSPVVHADETGSREDGRNGYIWSLSTPTVRFYHRDPSRGAAVIQELLGHNPVAHQARTARGFREAASAHPPGGSVFEGLLVSDFYAAYSWYAGPHQCCLVHLDRDLDELKASHPEEPDVGDWAERVIRLLERAKGYVRNRPDATLSQRRRARDAFKAEALSLARPYCRSGLPHETLAQRICRFIPTLFAFVAHPGAPADNNAAERAIRPFVIGRKVSGGTRSRQGSNTQAVLCTLFQTWALRGTDPLSACRQLLAGA